jgi:hypothetical protein
MVPLRGYKKKQGYYFSEGYILFNSIIWNFEYTWQQIIILYLFLSFFVVQKP